MRGIGKGQTIQLLVIPEVHQLVVDAKTQCGGPAITDASFVADACAWLYLNGMRSEHLQFLVLSKQNVQEMARKAALQQLFRALEFGQGGTGKPLPADAMSCGLLRYHCDDRSAAAIGLFSESVDFSPADSVDSGATFVTMLEALAQSFRQQGFIDGNDWAVVEDILQQLRRGSQGGGQGSDDSSSGGSQLDGTMQQEQEQEQEQHEEAQRRVEIITIPQGDSDRCQQVQWDVHRLSQPRPTVGSLDFTYRLAAFEVQRRATPAERADLHAVFAQEHGFPPTDTQINQLLSTGGCLTLGFPSDILITENFSRRRDM